MKKFSDIFDSVKEFKNLNITPIVRKIYDYNNWNPIVMVLVLII
jgi:hypothetical protein